MPKMKTHKGTKKRFRLTGTGKLKRRHANKSHILEKKTRKRKRQLRAPGIVTDADAPKIKRLLGKR